MGVPRAPLGPQDSGASVATSSCDRGGIGEPGRDLREANEGGRGHDLLSGEGAPVQGQQEPQGGTPSAACASLRGASQLTSTPPSPALGSLLRRKA